MAEATSDQRPHTVDYLDGVVVLLDQTALPDQERYVRCDTWQRVASAIADLEVRGAPVIGVTAAFGLALAAKASTAVTPDGLRAELGEVAAALIATRPTAVNLAWAVEAVMAAAGATADTVDEVQKAVEACSRRLHAEDLAVCRAIGDAGAALLERMSDVITHCNAGALATVGYGTALGVVRSAHRVNPNLHVWVDETRPVLQGARLTAFELGRDGIDCTVIADGAAASVLAAGGVGAAVVGADRIAANGDVANKIGTYGLAVSAPRGAVLRCCSTVHDRCRHSRRGRHRDRATSGGRGRRVRGQAHHPVRSPGVQPGVRRDPGRTDRRHRHRGRGVAGAVRSGHRRSDGSLTGGRIRLVGRCPTA